MLPALLVVTTILHFSSYTLLFLLTLCTFLFTTTIPTSLSILTHPLFTLLILLYIQSFDIYSFDLISISITILPSHPLLHFPPATTIDDDAQDTSRDDFNAIPRLWGWIFGLILSTYSISHSLITPCFIQSLFLPTRQHLDSCQGIQWSHMGAHPDHNESGQLIVS